MHREFGMLWPMHVKLFILGLPGSGKSAVARYISMRAKDRQWSTTHINDFAILYKMFEEDTEGQFRPASYGGFDVLEFAVFDTALRKLEQKVNGYIFPANSERLLLIEFSRNDYQKAFHQFSYEFLQDAYFLYLDAEISTCKRRILERIANPSSEDDFFVSEYIFDAYYNEDDGRSISQILAGDYGIEKQRVEVIENNGLLLDSIALINNFIDTICELENLRDS